MAPRLDSLPKELIAHVATFTEPTTLLRLSATCHGMRAACWDALVFKAVLSSSQLDNWQSHSLDEEEIAARAQGDVSLWARYCLADERARLLIAVPETVASPKAFISYLPELFVAKHPLMYDPYWRDSLRYRLDQQASHVFCLAMTALASAEPMPSLKKSLRMEGGWNIRGSDSEISYLWALCQIVLSVRAGLKIRLAAWPYNHAARVPHIALPSVKQIPLRSLSGEYRLPEPFSRKPIELLGSPRVSFSAWDSWYRQHNIHFWTSTAYLTTGSWCGYYIHFGSDPLSPLNPPMVDIKFELVDTPVGEWAGLHEARPRKICAKKCVDGLDLFDIEATTSSSTYGIKMVARKTYLNRNHGWDWDCRLTPFGIVGYWGLRDTIVTSTLLRQGVVWLWKKEWTEAP